MSRIINIGTRKSKLALWQANEVKRQLENCGFQCKIVPILSQGDLNLDRPLHELGITGIFTKTLDIALLNKDIDVAVHSLKDVPTKLPDGIIQSAVLKRSGFSDVFVINEKKDFDINSKPIIATGSLRRRAQWLNKYPQSRVIDLRGNVNTRLKKIQEGSCNGGVFAEAGLERLGIKPNKSITLSWMVPAPAQGVIMLATREDDDFINKTCNVLNHFETQVTSRIERDFLRKLEGGCTAPIGALAEIDNISENIKFQGIVLSRDGMNKITVEMTCELKKYKSLGDKCATIILNKGGKDLMEKDQKVGSNFTFYSTKKLSPKQKNWLPKNISFKENDFINISFQDIPEEILKKKIKNVIITSKNSVESILRSSKSINIDFENIFCVGLKTKDLIQENIGKVNLWRESSKELALELARIIPGQAVTYFCSDMRLDTLPAKLRENSIVIEEIKSYSTIFTPYPLNQKFSAVLFFSPSAVKSFMEVNDATGSALCIGEETASEAKNYFKDVQIADFPNASSLLELVSLNYRKN